MIYLSALFYGAFIFVCIYTYRISMGVQLWAHTRMKLVAILFAILPVVNIVILILALSGIQLQISNVLRSINSRMEEDPANPFHEVTQQEAQVYHKIINQLS